MPYIDASAWVDFKLVPTEGETYNDFMARNTKALQELLPTAKMEELVEICNRAWANFILSDATEVTVTMKRQMHQYSDVYSLEMYFGDWQITDVHSAVVPQYQITYNEAFEKAKSKNEEKEVFKIAKSAEDKQLVFGWANVAIDKDGTYPIDWDGDITEPEELEKAAYDFVLKHRVTGEMHEGEAKGNLVESIMFTKEKQEALGIPPGTVPEGWWVGFHVPDKEVFAKIKSGEYQMFSVEGQAVRQPAGEGR